MLLAFPVEGLVLAPCGVESDQAPRRLVQYKSALGKVNSAMDLVPTQQARPQLRWIEDLPFQRVRVLR